MPTERLKFRCYRCNQLLGSSASKAGTVVSCPKCQADLLVPPPEPQSGSEPELPIRPLPEGRARVEAEAPPSGRSDVAYRNEPASRTATVEPAARSEPASRTATVEPAARSEPVRTFVNDISAMIPPDLADLRPEDLRVEAEFFQSLTRAPDPAPATEPVSWPEPESPTFRFEEPVDLSGPPLIAERSGATAMVETAPAPPQTFDHDLRPTGTPAASTVFQTDVPQIEIEPPTILPPGHELGRIREIVLPASVVLAWSLFVLLGITLSFVAGLLMGHFLWKAP